MTGFYPGAGVLNLSGGSTPRSVVSVTMHAHDQAEAEARGDEAWRLAQLHGCPVKIVLPSGQVFCEVQPVLTNPDWCPGCTPDSCPGGCNR